MTLPSVLMYITVEPLPASVSGSTERRDAIRDDTVRILTSLYELFEQICIGQSVSLGTLRVTHLFRIYTLLQVPHFLEMHLFVFYPTEIPHFILSSSVCLKHSQSVKLLTSTGLVSFSITFSLKAKKFLERPELKP